MIPRATLPSIARHRLPMLRAGLLVTPLLLSLLGAGQPTDSPTTSPDTGTIKATVYDPDGKPVQDLVVVLQASNRIFSGPKSVSPGDSRWVPLQSLKVVARKSTDKDGVAEFPNLRPDVYRITAYKAGVGKAGQPITVEAGKVIEVRLDLKKVSAPPPPADK
jgi:hypothetical protein